MITPRHAMEEVMIEANVHLAVSGLKANVKAYLEVFREVSVSVCALRETLTEKIPGFEEAYSRHYADASKFSTNSPNAQGLERTLKDFDQVTKAILELYAEKR
jgi:hypothetical protein